MRTPQFLHLSCLSCLSCLLPLLSAGCGGNGSEGGLQGEPVAQGEPVVQFSVYYDDAIEQAKAQDIQHLRTLLADEDKSNDNYIGMAIDHGGSIGLASHLASL